MAEFEEDLLRSVTDLDIKAEEVDVGDDLGPSMGRGFNSVGLVDRGDAVDRTGAKSAMNPSVVSDVTYIDSYRSLYELIKASVQASYSGFSGSAGVSASFASETKLKSYNAYLLVRKRVETRRVRLVAPTLKSSAQSLLRDDPDQFLDMYGDRFVDSITYGGALYILLEYDAGSEERRESFRLQAQGAYGGFSASADLSRKFAETGLTNSLTFKSTVLGLLQSGDIPRVGKLDSSAAEQLFGFTDRLEEELAAKPELWAEMHLGSSGYDICEGRTATMPSFQKQQRFLWDLTDYRDRLALLQERVEWTLENEALFDDLNIDVEGEKLGIIEAEAAEVNRYAAALLTDPASVSSAFDTASSLPEPAKPSLIPSIPVVVEILGFMDKKQVKYTSAPGRFAQLPDSNAVPQMYRLVFNARGRDLSITASGELFRFDLNADHFKDQLHRFEDKDINALKGYFGMGKIGLSLRGADAHAYTISYVAKFGKGKWPKPNIITLSGSDGEILGDGLPTTQLRDIAVSILRKR